MSIEFYTFDLCQQFQLERYHRALELVGDKGGACPFESPQKELESARDRLKAFLMQHKNYRELVLCFSEGDEATPVDALDLADYLLTKPDFMHPAETFLCGTIQTLQALYLCQQVLRNEKLMREKQ